MPTVRRLSIAAKLLLWSGALILIFFAATAFLFRQVRNDAETANRLVAVNHEVDSAIQRMLDRLYGVRDNILRYRLTESQEAVQYIVTDLTRFGEILRETLEKHPEYTEDWRPAQGGVRHHPDPWGNRRREPGPGRHDPGLDQHPGTEPHGQPGGHGDRPYPAARGR